MSISSHALRLHSSVRVSKSMGNGKIWPSADLKPLNRSSPNLKYVITSLKIEVNFCYPYMRNIGPKLSNVYFIFLKFSTHRRKIAAPPPSEKMRCVDIGIILALVVNATSCWFSSSVLPGSSSSWVLMCRICASLSASDIDKVQCCNADRISHIQRISDRLHQQRSWPAWRLIMGQSCWP